MESVDPRLEIQSIARKNRVLLTAKQMNLLAEFVEVLIRWNQKINLISRKDEQNIWYSHILHSLSPLFYVDFASGLRVLDLGSGGGLPGIPLAIARPDLDVTLLDSIRKKTMVLEELKMHLGLTNVQVRTVRAEDLAKEPVSARSFDLVVARAVAPLVELVRWCKPLVRPRRTAGAAEGGESRMMPVPKILALKGGDLQNEIRETRLKVGRVTITVINMSFAGSIELGLEDKKLVLVDF